MKISIITVCFNSENTIKDTIESIISQDYKNLEYIIVDGGSSDNTLNIIDNYIDKVDTLISGPDKGIYDAMNKGITAASGVLIGILNSDDIYAKTTVISDVVSDQLYTLAWNTVSNIVTFDFIGFKDTV